MKWLNDNKLLRNFFSVVIWIVAYGAAIVWFGLFKDLDLDTVVLVDTGALTVIGFLAVKSLRWDITHRAFIAENIHNDELVEVNEDIINENKKIDDDILGQEYIDQYNKIKQDKANKTLTNYKLSKLRKKLRKIRIKTKKLFLNDRKFADYQKKIIGKYTQQITLLENNPVFDKKYKSVKYDDIISIGDAATKKAIPEHKKFKYDPKKDAWWSWFFSIFKFVGIGSTSIPFAINRQDWSVLGVYYIALTITALITVIRRYLTIRKRTGGPYLQYRRDALKFMRNINTYITNSKADREIKLNQEKVDKGSILKTDKDVVFTMDGNAYFVHRMDFFNLMESPGKYGFGKTYMEAYNNMIEDQRKENLIIDFIESLKDKDGEFVYTFEDIYGVSLEVFTQRIENCGYTVKIVKDSFGRKPNIMRIKEEIK